VTYNSHDPDVLQQLPPHIQKLYPIYVGGAVGLVSREAYDLIDLLVRASGPAHAREVVTGMWHEHAQRRELMYVEAVDYYKEKQKGTIHAL
jgi:hypothetical protein